MNVTKSLKEKSINGQIKESDAITIAKKADELLTESVILMDELKKHFGLFIGGQISELQAKIKGIAFNEREYNYERRPDGQE